MWGFGYEGGWMVPVMGVSALLWWVLVVVVVVALVRWLRSLGGANAPRAGRNEALEALDLGFARGEIDADEHAARRRQLSGV